MVCCVTSVGGRELEGYCRSSGGDDWSYPTRFIRLGCRFGLGSVSPVDVVFVYLMCQVLARVVIHNYYSFLSRGKGRGVIAFIVGLSNVRTTIYW
jgi:hypothetical protein